jgi:NADPH-dependent glutamate synthase beta subunit-like oxidoreductase
VTSCPVNVPIPQFIKAVTEKDYAQAVATIKTTNLLPARKEEVEHAQHEGVQFNILTAPVKVLGN